MDLQSHEGIMVTHILDAMKLYKDKKWGLCLPVIDKDENDSDNKDALLPPPDYFHIKRQKSNDSMQRIVKTEALTEGKCRAVKREGKGVETNEDPDIKEVSEVKKEPGMKGKGKGKGKIAVKQERNDVLIKNENEEEVTIPDNSEDESGNDVMPGK